jgi:hypothetical protein
MVSCRFALRNPQYRVTTKVYLLIILFCVVFATAFLSAPFMGAGWGWDADNAAGFAALAGMLYLSSPGEARRDLRTHEWLGTAVLAVAAIHASWFLLVDAAAVEYIRPGAPLYMWSGIAALMLFAMLVLLARLPTRMTAHKSYGSFRWWHRLIAFAGLAGALHHIIASGFYLQTWYQAALLVFFCLGVVLVRRVPRGEGQSAPVSVPGFLLVSGAGIALFTLVRNVAP